MAGSGPNWYAPTDNWPQHPSPWFRSALNKARATGWWYRKAANAGHIHGTAYCQGPGKRAEACKFPIYSTGKAGETAAMEFERLIRRCPHAKAGAGPLAAASVHMDKVDLLCSGAEALLDQHDYDQDSASFFDRAEQLLDEAGKGTGVVDDLLQSAIDREMEARAAGNEAERALTLAGTDLRDPGQVLDVAEETNSQVRAALIEEEPSPDVRDLKARVRNARVKIQSLRSRLPQR